MSGVQQETHEAKLRYATITSPGVLAEQCPTAVPGNGPCIEGGQQVSSRGSASPSPYANITAAVSGDNR